MTVALVTGFEPYNGAALNPSGQIALALEGTGRDGLSIHGRVLPVSAKRSPAAVTALIDELEPDVLLMLGLWPGRHAFQVERIAINVLDFPYPDNDGAQPDDGVVVPDGPPAYLARVPVRAVAAAWRDSGLPGVISSSAGTYLCNQSFYVALHHTAGRSLPVGFVHLPASLSEASKDNPPIPGLPLATLTDGVVTALEAIVAATSTSVATATHALDTHPA